VTVSVRRPAGRRPVPGRVTKKGTHRSLGPGTGHRHTASKTGREKKCSIRRKKMFPHGKRVRGTENRRKKKRWTLLKGTSLTHRWGSCRSRRRAAGLKACPWGECGERRTSPRRSGKQDTIISIRGRGKLSTQRRTLYLLQRAKRHVEGKVLMELL